MKVNQPVGTPGAARTSHMVSERAVLRAATPTAGSTMSGAPRLQLQDGNAFPPEVVRILLELAESGVDLEDFGIQSRRQGEPGVGQTAPTPTARSMTTTYASGRLADASYLTANRDAGQVRVMSAVIPRAVAGEVSPGDLNLLLSALNVSPGVVERSIVSLGLDPARISMCGMMYHLVGGKFAASVDHRPKAALSIALSPNFSPEELLFAVTSVVIVGLIVAILAKLA